MWYTTKRAVAGLALSAVMLGAGGCATTGEQRNVAYAEPDIPGLGPQPPRANTIYGMTRLMRSQGKTEQAELALIGLMREYPNYSPTYNDLAEIRLEQGRMEEAMHYVERGLEVAPNDVVLLNNAGVCHLMKHDYATALDYFKRASGLAPYENRYRANVALAMGLNGDIEGSRALYSQIVSKEQADHNAALIQSMVAPAPTATAEAPAPIRLEDFALLSPAPDLIPLPTPLTTEETITSKGVNEAATEEAAEQEPLTPEI